MSLRIRIKNPDLNREEVTSLTSDIAAAGTALAVVSNDDFAANDIAVAGNPGEEKTESSPVSSVAGNSTINVTALKFSHPAGTSLFRSLFNQVSLERQASSTGSFSEIAEGKIYIDFDSKDGYTIVSSAASSTVDSFRWRFYNTATGVYSAYSDTLVGTGLTAKSIGTIIDEVRTLARIPDHQALSDEQIINWINECNRYIASEYDRWWFLLTTSTALTAVDTFQYALPTDFARMEALLFNDGTVNYRLKYITLPEFDALRIDSPTQPSDDTLRYYTFLPPDATSTKGYIGVWTTPKTASLTLTYRYYKDFTTLDTFADQTPLPIPTILINYALYRYWTSKNQSNEATSYYNMYVKDLESVKRMQKRDTGEAELFRWRGPRGRSKLFGTRAGFYNDSERENYW